MEQVSCDVKKITGEVAGTVSLPAEAFGAKIALDSVHETVVWQLAKRRAGTHATLRKGDVPGRSQKPWRQKGTGRARAGDKKSPHWVGGAVAHGPQPRSYGGRLSRRVRKTALASTLTDKFNEGSVIVLDSIPADVKKTREWRKIFNDVGLATQTAVVALAPSELEAARAMRNLPGILPMPVEGVNVYDLLRHDAIVFSKECARHLAERVGVVVEEE